jgi:hypothetical protein
MIGKKLVKVDFCTPYHINVVQKKQGDKNPGVNASALIAT